MNNRVNIGLIFDLDGCLIDSKEVQKKALFESYREVVGDDKCPSYEEYIKYTGDSVDNVLRKLGLPAAMAKPFRIISSKSIDKISINWEAIDLIKDLRVLGFKIAICTGKDHYRTEDILKYYGIKNLFDVLICADDVPEPKPSAIPILMAAEKMSFSTDRTLMIGDGYNDILSAKNAGVKSVLTLWYGDEGVPRESDYVVDSVAELKTILYKLYF